VDMYSVQLVLLQTGARSCVIMSLQLLDDIFSVNTTLQSNHTLQHLVLDSLDTEKGIQTHIDMSTDYRDQCKA